MTTARSTLRKISYSVMDMLKIPRTKPVQESVSVDDLRAIYKLPVTLGASESVRVAMDSEFSATVNTLAEHAIELGQYPSQGFLGYSVLQSIAQNGMIRACIQTVADEMTREWLTVNGGDNTEEAVLDSLNDKLEKKYHLRSNFNRALSVMGYMGGSFLFIDTGAEDTSKPLEISEQSAEFAKGRPVKFVVVDPIVVAPCEYNAIDPLKADYMKPSMWLVLGRRVHASRLLKFVDNIPPILLSPAYNFLGIPQAQILWDYVLHWNKSRVASCNLLEKMNFMIFKTDAMQYLSTPDGLTQLDAKVNFMSRYRDNDSVFVCDTEAEDVQNVAGNIGGATDVAKQALEFVACICRVPAVKLLGMSPAGFNATGESDIRNYYDHIRSKQEKFRDNVEACLKAIQLSEYGHIDPSITFDWNELGADDESQKVATATQTAQLLTTLQDHQVLSAEEVRNLAKANDSMGLGSIDDEMPEQPNPQGESPMSPNAQSLQDKIQQALSGGAKEQPNENPSADRG